MANTLGTIGVILRNLHRPAAYMLDSAIEEVPRYKGDGSDLNKFYSDIEEEVSTGKFSKLNAFAAKRPALTIIAIPLLAAATGAWLYTRQFVQKLVRGIGWVAGGAGALAIVGGLVCELVSKVSGSRDKPTTTDNGR